MGDYISQDTVENLIASMPRRIKAVERYWVEKSKSWIWQVASLMDGGGIVSFESSDETGVRIDTLAVPARAVPWKQMLGSKLQFDLTLRPWRRRKLSKPGNKNYYFIQQPFSCCLLVPFVIDPAFTTIFMEFDEEAAFCVTSRIDRRLGASTFSWTSCREGCTKDIYDCTQIFVNYKILSNHTNTSLSISRPTTTAKDREILEEEDYSNNEDSEWDFVEAKLLPNVKGCGYPPMLNCTNFLKSYKELGTNFSCYYSRIKPSMVISHLDMWQVYLNLVYAMAIPIPSFIISVIYLTIAYFKIYKEDEDEAPLKKNAEAIDMEGESGTPIPPSASGGITPASKAFREDLASFGHHFKVATINEISRDSLVDGVINKKKTEINFYNFRNIAAKTMTTSISTTGGPVADI
ncbi:hypothetical protein NQ317_011516 [Molorchus minor]|uniref:Protein tipE n=1 Tax=Molorchus minor TaxID=1323400 RepID=A0ABQ9J0L5_9CUCU|nr:hypothetical protein NQ317_011516 [Molorchus minor]